VQWKETKIFEWYFAVITSLAMKKKNLRKWAVGDGGMREERCLMWVTERSTSREAERWRWRG